MAKLKSFQHVTVSAKLLRTSHYYALQQLSSKGTCQENFHVCLWVFQAGHCSHKGVLKKKKKKKRKMAKFDFHRFQVRHFSNNFEQPYGNYENVATPKSRSKSLLMHKIHHQGKYQRVNANTLYCSCPLVFLPLVTNNVKQSCKPVSGNPLFLYLSTKSFFPDHACQVLISYNY